MLVLLLKKEKFMVYSEEMEQVKHLKLELKYDFTFAPFIYILLM